MLLVCADSLKKLQRVIYIDTTNSFSVKRLLDLVQSDEERVKPFLDLIHVFRVHDVYDLHRLLDQLMVQINQGVERPSVLIVDSISAILSSVCNFDSRQGYASIECMGRALKNLASFHGLPILVTNHEVTGTQHSGQRRFREPRHCALGNVWRSQVHTRVHLQSCNGNWKAIEYGKTVAYIQLHKHEITTSKQINT